MKSVARLRTMTAITIATPENQSALQKGPDLKKEDFATYQPYPFMQLNVGQQRSFTITPDHQIKPGVHTSICRSFRQATYWNYLLPFLIAQSSNSASFSEFSAQTYDRGHAECGASVTQPRVIHHYGPKCSVARDGFATNPSNQRSTQHNNHGETLH